MAETAAHLVDRVIPVVPVRQWVLTLPYPSRCVREGGMSLHADVAVAANGSESTRANVSICGAAAPPEFAAHWSGMD